MWPSDIPIGKVIEINGKQFIKIDDTHYQAAEKVSVCDLGATGTMQSWNGCSALTTPTYTAGIKHTYFTQGPCLTDTRDGKNYEIRKFPDGKCWMVDNLAYGGTTTQSGTTDYCSGKTSLPTYGYGTGTVNTAWYGKTGTQATGTGTAAQIYGDCANPRTNAVSTGPCYNSDQCGYVYNWQAALQLPNCNYNVSCSYTTPSTTADFVQGICPQGWHIPSGGTNITASEFQKLHNSVGGGATDTSNNSTPYTTFWKAASTTTITSSDPWKGLYSGFVYPGGFVSDQGSIGYWWSASSLSALYSYGLGVYTSSVIPQYYLEKYYGFSVRCVQN
jgi:uncharacterized protein (TIGR02145 family)